MHILTCNLLVTNLLGLKLIDNVLNKKLPFGYFTILHIHIHFQNFHENKHEIGGMLL
jgi:hypothetical protein